MICVWKMSWYFQKWTIQLSLTLLFEWNKVYFTFFSIFWFSFFSWGWGHEHENRFAYQSSSREICRFKYDLIRGSLNLKSNHNWWISSKDPWTKKTFSVTNFSQQNQSVGNTVVRRSTEFITKPFFIIRWLPLQRYPFSPKGFRGRHSGLKIHYVKMVSAANKQRAHFGVLHFLQARKL